MMFILRDIKSGALLGEPFARGAFTWHGTGDRCEMTAAAGLEYKGAGDAVLQKVYEIIETSEGDGSAASVGAPLYNAANDRVTRHTVRSKSPADLAREETQWLRARAEAYRDTILDMKAVPSSEGGKIDCLGFALDAVITEIYAIRQGNATTAEFSELLTRIAAVKQAFPK